MNNPKEKVQVGQIFSIRKDHSDIEAFCLQYLSTLEEIQQTLLKQVLLVYWHIG